MAKTHIESLLGKLPKTPGVYKMKNEDGMIIYVGKAKNLSNRVRSYFRVQKERSVRTQKITGQRHTVSQECSTRLPSWLLGKTLVRAGSDRRCAGRKVKSRYARMLIVHDADGSAAIRPPSYRSFDGVLRNRPPLASLVV